MATGVGSLPHTEAKAAVNLVFDTLSFHIPFWPQLPRRSFHENMYVQFCEKFPGICVDEKERTIFVNTQSPQYLAQMEEVFNKCQAVDVDYFAINRSAAEGLDLFSKRLMGLNWQGWVKAQIIGPLSLGLSLLDENKNPILYNAELGQLLPLFLSLKVSWLIEQLRVNTRTGIIIFIDEPYLVAIGTSQCSLPKPEIIDMINQVVRVIHDNGALAGLHCCGNTDWELVMATDIDILNFDAYGYLDKVFLYEGAVASFLKKGRIPAIGIVPNNEDLLKDGLSDQLLQILKQRPAFLKNGALITTSCGCSGLSQELALKACEVSVEVAERLKYEL